MVQAVSSLSQGVVNAAMKGEHVRIDQSLFLHDYDQFQVLVRGLNDLRNTVDDRKAERRACAVSKSLWTGWMTLFIGATTSLRSSGIQTRVGT